MNWDDERRQSKEVSKEKDCRRTDKTRMLRQECERQSDALNE